MTAESRKSRILELIIEKVFGSIAEDEEKELNKLLDHPDEKRSDWEPLLIQENLIDYISANHNSGKESDLEAAKTMFKKLTDKGDNNSM